MGEELGFRAVLGLAAVVQNGLASRALRGTAPMRTVLQKRDEGLLVTVVLGGLLFVYCVAVTTYLIYPPWMAWSALPLAAWLRWLGLVPLLPGVALIVSGARHLGRNWTLSVSTRDDHELVTTGPYAWVRHPLYAGILLGSVGAALLAANGVVGGSGVSMWLLLARRTRLEEANLVARFGDAYREYQRRVPRLIPRPPRPGGARPAGA
jgi:protein-S-isoprenylcysteine O-methyltransferase Ste14